MTRLSGLDTVSAVESLTATINSFNQSALDSTTIINKLANVDAAFAVSSGDLAEAIKRVGSSAQDVGVNFDELLAIVTSVQQTTARGGAVIGNSLKTIFTRIQRTETLDQLEALGVQVRTLEGNTLPAVQVLQNLAGTFDKLGDSQKAQVAETVGGVFQINVLKAALGDLSKEYSVYKNALDVARSATDEAIIRNEKLNETIAALLNQTFVNFTKVGAQIGNISFGPTLKNVLELLNKGLSSLSGEGEGVGNKLGKGILEGIGTFISGPGLVLISAVFFKLFGNLAKFATESLKTLLNINSQTQQRAIIEKQISAVLAQEPNLLGAIINKQVSVLSLENKILETIRAQTLARQQASAISTNIAGNLMGRGVVVTKSGSIQTKSEGFIPSIQEELDGAKKGGYQPGDIRKVNIPGEGNVIYNTAEEIKMFKGFTQPAIIPPKNSFAGRKYKENFIAQNGFDPYEKNTKTKSKGFIPNFSVYDTLLNNIRNRTRGVDQQITSAYNNKKITDSDYRLLQAEKEQARTTLAPSLLNKNQNSLRETRTFNANSLGILALRGSGSTTSSTSIAQLPIFSNLVKRNPELANKIVQFQNIQVKSLEELGRQKPAEFISILNEEVLPDLAKVSQRFLGTVLGNQGDAIPQILGSLKGGKSFLPPGSIGDLFEASVKIATKNPKQFVASVDDDFRRPFDFEEGGAASKKFKDTFGFSPNLLKADAKLTADPRSIRSIIGKAYNSGIPDLPYMDLFATQQKIKKSNRGFIPNFADTANPALEDAIKREISAGTPMNKIKIGSDFRLSSKNNPLGLGVYNTNDEPLGLSQGINRYSSLDKAQKAGSETYSKGYIPNFQNVYVPPTAQFEMEKRILQAQSESVKNWNYINANTRAYNNNLSKVNSTLDITNKQLGKFGPLAGSLASIGIPIAISTLQQYTPQNTKVAGINVNQGLGVLSNTATFAGTGALIGSAFPGAGTVIGGAVGAGVGLGVGVYNYIKALQDIDFQKLSGELELLKERNSNAANALSQLLPLVGQYQDVMNSGLSQPVKEANLGLISDKISEVLESVPENLRENILNTIQQGNYEEVGGLIAQAITQGAKEASLKEAEVLFEGIRKSGGVIDTKETATQAGRAILNIRGESGERVISTKVKTEEGKKQVADIIKELESIPENINPESFTALNAATKELADKESKFSDKTSDSIGVLDFVNKQFADTAKSGSVLEFAAEKAGIDLSNSSDLINDQAKNTADFLDDIKKSDFDRAVENLGKGLSSQGESIDITLSQILDKLRPLYEDTADTKIAFDKIAEDAKEIYLKGGTIKDIKTYIINALRNTLKNEETIQKISEENITNAAQFARAFKLRTLNEKKISKYLDALNASQEYDPGLVTGRAQAEQYELIRKEITNQQSRNIVDEQVKQKQQELTKLLDEKKITEDQYINAVRGYTQSVILAEKRAKGLVFAEDYRAGRQQARESRILGGQANPMDVFEAFGDEMSYKTEDLYRTMQLGAGDTARTIKSEFGNAFQSIIDGSQTAGDAFRNMALNIAQRIQQLALDAAVNSALGGFFGLFGFNKGGFVDSFSNLVKKRDGGYIKGYAYGGAVEGGSGVRDDVPAMLNAGEYVIKKSAVKKYGMGFLEQLNNKRFETAEEGMFFNSNLKTYDPKYGDYLEAKKPRTDYGFWNESDLPDQRTFGALPQDSNTTGGAYKAIGRDVFSYNDPFAPTGGQRESSPFLSALALTDPNNPQNEVVRQRGEDLVKYIADQVNYQEELAKAKAEFEEQERKRYAEWQDTNNAIRKNWENQRWSNLGMGALQGGAILGAGALQTYGVPALKNWLTPGGGNMFMAGNAFGSSEVRKATPVKRAKGSPAGGEKDTIPALLTGGEYVINKDAVDNYGRRFFDDLNYKRINKFADGGYVGTPQNIQDQNSQSQQNNASIANNINISVNVSPNGTVSTNTQQSQQNTNSSNKTSTGMESDVQQGKALAEKIKAEVIKVISQQQRPGGLLRK